MGRIRQPGTRSNFQLLFSSLFTVAGLLILIGGHLLIVIEGYFRYTGEGSIQSIAKYLMLPEWSLWAAMGIALAMDIWIFYHDRSARKKALKR